MVAVLRKVAMSVEQAQETTDAVLKNPTKYGFWKYKLKPNKKILPTACYGRYLTHYSRG